MADVKIAASWGHTAMTKPLRWAGVLKWAMNQKSQKTTFKQRPKTWAGNFSCSKTCSLEQKLLLSLSLIGITNSYILVYIKQLMYGKSLQKILRQNKTYTCWQNCRRYSLTSSSQDVLSCALIYTTKKLIFFTFITFVTMFFKGYET